MKCKMCDGKTHNVFSVKIFNKHNIKYYYCNYCGFLQIENLIGPRKLIKHPLTFQIQVF